MHESILSEEVALVVEANPELITDEVLRDLVVRGLKGTLKGKPGRKRTTVRMLKELYVVAIYDTLLPQLQARAARQKALGHHKGRADRSPAECAQYLIGQRFGMAEESVRNLISRKKNG